MPGGVSVLLETPGVIFIDEKASWTYDIYYNL